jgi:hypothetical protein
MEVIRSQLCRDISKILNIQMLGDIKMVTHLRTSLVQVQTFLLKHKLARGTLAGPFYEIQHSLRNVITHTKYIGASTGLGLRSDKLCFLCCLIPKISEMMPRSTRSSRLNISENVDISNTTSFLGKPALQLSSSR